MLLNVVLPALFAVTYPPIIIADFVKKETPGKFASLCFYLNFILINVLVGISCFIIMRDVYRIRRYLVSKGAKDYINTSMLLRHAAAFGIVFAAIVLNTATYIVYLFNGSLESLIITDIT